MNAILIMLRKKILEAFNFPELEEENNIKIKKLMDQTESVSVHIRKGDYINSEMINLDIKYYESAKKKIEEKIKNPKYFLFSDDKENMREYLNLFQDAVLVDGNTGKNSFRDMQLMSFCKHNIIANSTFSFWGAYLNKNTQKVVIAPDKAKHDFRHAFACQDWCVIPWNH